MALRCLTALARWAAHGRTARRANLAGTAAGGRPRTKGRAGCRRGGVLRWARSAPRAVACTTGDRLHVAGRANTLTRAWTRHPKAAIAGTGLGATPAAGPRLRGVLGAHRRHGGTSGRLLPGTTTIAQPLRTHTGHGRAIAAVRPRTGITATGFGGAGRAARTAAAIVCRWTQTAGAH